MKQQLENIVKQKVMWRYTFIKIGKECIVGGDQKNTS